MNLVNQTVGLAQTGRQGQPADGARPAEDEAAGAAPGTRGADRAPVERAAADTGTTYRPFTATSGLAAR